MAGPDTPRARARERTLAEIKQIARAQIAEHGAAELSLRAIARDLGVVSSAVYRYFDSRDAVLTALIIDSYDQLAAAVTASAMTAPASAPRKRFIAACKGFREWARARPHEFALIYGSPVPGYAAPEETIGSAASVVRPFAQVLVDATDRGDLAEPPAIESPAALRNQLTAAGAGLAAPDSTPLSAGLTAAFLSVVSELIGLVSLELYGHFAGTLDPADRYAAMRFAEFADRVGLSG